jgi:polar amino acid transport system substrate-binding protein
MRLILASLFLASIFTLFAVPLRAESVKFCFVKWEPYTVIIDGKATGISIDILREASARSDITATFHELPWKRCLRDVLQETMDAVIDASYRAAYLQGPASHSSMITSFWVKSNSPHQKYTGPQQWNGKSVGVVLGYIYGDVIVKNDAINKEAVNTDTDALIMLDRGLFDTALADMINSTIIIKDNDLDIRAIGPALEVSVLYPSFSPTRSTAHEKIDKAINLMIDDGTIDRIYQKYIGLNYGELLKKFSFE